MYLLLKTDMNISIELLIENVQIGEDVLEYGHQKHPKIVQIHSYFSFDLITIYRLNTI
jgi:hypothetical protein